MLLLKFLLFSVQSSPIFLFLPTSTIFPSAILLVLVLMLTFLYIGLRSIVKPQPNPPLLLISLIAASALFTILQLKSTLRAIVTLSIILLLLSIKQRKTFNKLLQSTEVFVVLALYIFIVSSYSLSN